ncbi:MAG: hypothetical protein DMF78_17535 [Acidobacteria bacterium]|nr:MAG: hypothetical protein DMF78_17535 [Acidobacteriota bacterium]
MPTTSPSQRRSEAGSARPIVVLLLAMLAFAAGAVSAWWYLTQRQPQAPPRPAPDFGPLTPSAAPPTPETGPATPAPAEAAPSPAAEAQPAPAAPAAGAARAATAGKGRPPKPAPAAPAIEVGQMLSQAESAASEKRYADAADLYDRVLKADPGNEAARAGKARIGAMGAPRRFVLGTTTVESLRGLGKGLEGFDTAGVGVKRAPTVEGLLELVMEPAKVNAGDAYAVKVFLKNAGKKAIDVDEMKVSMIVDGKWSTRPLPAKVKQVAPKQRALLQELPGVWRAGVKDWAVEAVVTSRGQDVYRNRLTWK